MEFRNVGRSRPARLAGRPRLQQLRRAASTSRRPRASCTGRSTPASRCSTPRTRMATAAAPRRFLGELLGDRRKDIVLATKFGMAMDDAGMRKGASRALHHVGGRGEPHAAAHRLDRPLPAAPARPADADRGDAARARRPRARKARCATSAAPTSPAWQVADAAWTSRHHGLAAFVCAQDEYSLLAREHEQHLLPALQKFGLGFLPYYPLAGGLLTGKYRRDAPLPEGARLTVLQAARPSAFSPIATGPRVEGAASVRRGARGHTLLELAFGWLAARPLGVEHHRRAPRSPSRSTPTSRAARLATRAATIDRTRDRGGDCAIDRRLQEASQRMRGSCVDSTCWPSPRVRAVRAVVARRRQDYPKPGRSRSSSRSRRARATTRSDASPRST